MGMFNLSTEFQKEIHKQCLSSQQRVFADLLLVGYRPKDAFILCGLYEERKDLKYNNTNLNELLNNTPALSNYLAEKKLKADEKKAKEEKKEQVNEEDISKAFSLNNKEDAIAALEALLPDADTKDAKDIVMKISELRGWKKEEVKDDVELVKYFLPLTCNNCSLYIKAQKERRKQ